MKIQTWGPREDFDHEGNRVHVYMAEALGTDGRYHVATCLQQPTEFVEVQEATRQMIGRMLKGQMTDKGVWQKAWDDLTVEGVRDALMDNENVGDWELHEGSFDPNAWGGLGTVEHVASVGGSEGSGELMYYVLKCGSRYFRQEGYYASWGHSKWDGRFREVHPVEKTVVVWNDK